MKSLKINNEKRDRIIGFLFFLPWIIGFCTLTIYPIVYSIRLSVSDVQLLPGKTQMEWVGLHYFNEAWNVDTQFRGVISGAVMMILCSTPVITVFSLIIAILLNGKFLGRAFFRAVYFLPVIVMSGPAISKLLTGYTVDFSSSNPEIFTFLNVLPSFLSTPSKFILENLVLIFWNSGVQILLFLAGLQKISPSLYEAASIDGAGKWESFWTITLPHISPIAIITAVYTIVDISNSSTLSINEKITRHLFDTSRLYSFSAAMSWIYFLVVLLMLLAVFFVFFFMNSKQGR